MKSADEQRFAVVAAAHAPALRRAAFVLSGDWHLADDLVQKALLKLFLGWPLRDEGAVAAWLTRTMVRGFVDETRRPWWRRESSAETLPDVAARAHSTSLDDDLLAQLGALPPRQRACLVLRYLEDYFLEQTADALQCSVGTVKAHTSRGLDVLRKRMGVNPTPLLHSIERDSR